MQPNPELVITERAEYLFPGAHRAVVSQAAENDCGLQCYAVLTSLTRHLFDADLIAERAHIQSARSIGNCDQNLARDLPRRVVRIPELQERVSLDRAAWPHGRVVKNHVLIIKADDD